MGNFKEQNREGVREMRENSNETKEIGNQMNQEANEIKSLLDSIELQDSEDIQEINEAGRSYQGSFDSAFSEQVETAGQQVEQQGAEIRNASEGELENVRSGISKLERAEGVSEIGRDAAESARSSLEGSAGEYEEIISEAEEVADELNQQIESLKSDIGSVFG